MMEEDLSGLTLLELLDLLEPPPDPAPVSMVPQTVGWIWLGLGLLVLLVLAVRRFMRHRRETAYRRAALKALDAAGNDPAQIAQVLRRAALAAFPRRQVAALTGADWLAFLDRTMGGNGFADGPGRSLVEAPYRDTPPDPDLPPLARRWIRHHRAGEAEA